MSDVYIVFISLVSEQLFGVNLGYIITSLIVLNVLV